ncbi:M48 family metallopeptidase [Aurantiacibacter poecillastricola]|uniref:M48 family metallopeptidase n=1 Tax=Aurantiacibacter poecillastricola TaxID=3064385 RepID=UPI00273E03F4|nr:M48 family metallopeptidase [Aurantiacibacter sp. 219JJ12-13]MDP5261962.1 M48 family metallopeptidase [Aurantiacibacter sp. 219JJ12-13]
MKTLIAALALIALAVASPSALAQSMAELAEQDLRLARIADAMLIANAPLCRTTMPVTGMVLHSMDQYGEDQRDLFANGPLAVASVVPGSAADSAGILAGDGIAAIGGMAVSSMTPEGPDHLREEAFFRLADLPDDRPVEIVRLRDGDSQPVTLHPRPGCRSLVEILVADGPNARSNGRIIQFQYDFAVRLTDPELAVVLAHELAHSVLEHRRRKEEAGIDNASLFRHFGRNQRVNRLAEVEADRLSVHLLANAGYDPLLAASFWRSLIGIEAGGGPMPSFIYPSQEARAELVEREVAMYLGLGRGPSWPGHLLVRRESSFAND